MSTSTFYYIDGPSIEEGDAVLYGAFLYPSKVVEIMYSAGQPDAVVLEDGATGRNFLSHSIDQIHYVGRKSNNIVADGLDFLHKKAAGGSMRAQYALGHLYLNGVGIKADLSMALKFWEQAADSNCAPALYDLGQLYENGNGVAVDSEKAISYYDRAGQLGFPPAQQAAKILKESTGK